MALLRKLLYKKPPDGLLDFFERIYVFDSCFRTETWEQEEYKGYVGRIITQFKETYPESSVMIFNFREGDTASKIHMYLAEHFITIMDFPKHYEGCPLVSMEALHHFLKASESWLSLGQQNNLLVHSELGGWPVLAFLLAALLLYRKYVASESRALEIVHKQAPPDTLPLMSALYPTASQLRYLQYVSKRNADEQWPPGDKALKLDCVMMRMIPDSDGKGGCCPVFRIYGRDPSLQVDKTPKLLFSTPRGKRNTIRSYNQAENEMAKIDIKCNIQGDIVLECIHLDDDMVKETTMYCAMFNTAFIISNKLMLNREEVDISWDKKDQFPKDFIAELFFSEMDATASEVLGHWSCFGNEGLPVEAFCKVQEMNFNREEVDICWDAKDKFPRDIKAKRPFSEMDAAASMVPVDLCGFEAEGLPMEVFGMVQEMKAKVRDLQQSQIALEKEFKDERRAREALQQQVKELTRRLDNPFGTPSNS